MITPANIAAALLLLVPYLAIAFFSQSVTAWAGRWPQAVRLLAPVLFAVPYVLVTTAAGDFRWGWLAVYALLPVAIAVLLHQASRMDPGEPATAATEPPVQRGKWRDFVILAVLGLAVDLRWFERAWPAHMSVFNKVLLLDAGIYGFVLIRRLEGTGFDLRLRLRDAGIGLREVVFYTPIALALGLSLGFSARARSVARAGRHCPGLVVYFFLYRCPGGAFLPRMGAESA